MFQTTIRSEQGNKKNDSNSTSKNKPKINFGEMLKGHASVPDLGKQPAQMMVEEEEEKPTQKKAIQKKTMVEDEEELQMKEAPEKKSESSGTSGTKVSMPDSVRGKMENSFGTDFSNVNIHKDSGHATNIGALAYTQGNDVHFAPGQYNPESSKGQELLGHELTHVVQQRQGRVQPTKQGKGMSVNDSPALENEADVMGARAAQGKDAQVVGVGNGVQKQDGDDLDKEPVEENPLSDNNQDFFTNIKTYIEEQITLYTEKLESEETKYEERNWAIDYSQGNFLAYSERIDLLENYKTEVESIETIAKSKGTSGNGLLTLMNVVHNEAANYRDDAKLAVAYAYLNRIEYSGDGDIREPEGDSEISHYSELNDRWNNYSTTADRLEFLRNIKSSFDAANSRIENCTTDPTDGATHWVSPIGLDSASGANDTKAGYYPRNYPGVGWKFFPNWARSNEWVDENPTKASAWFNVSEYEEIIATGVAGSEFLFYKGVKY